MAERTVSIVIDVSGADDATREVRRVRSAFDDLLGGGQERLQMFARRGREVTMAEMSLLELEIAGGEIILGLIPHREKTTTVC